MQFRKSSSAWWGPPKKLETNQQERQVSWQELFFDLVYVIAIARITHHLSLHFSLGSFVEYSCLFTLIYWGWLNGSLHHDLHGNDGLRTRLMTLWQMMIIAALAILIDHLPEVGYFNITIGFMVMQLFITYMWWSVGIYDKAHRRYNRPYTILYLCVLGLMGLSLAVPLTWLKVIFPLIILCNYAPPFISYILLRQSARDLDMSSSMFERLGLFTIIIFGELVLGVVNGISETQALNLSDWLFFSLALSIVFALWWLYFTMISRWEAKKGFANASLLELLQIPALISLGVIAVCLSEFFDPHEKARSLQNIFGYALSMFLVCISLMIGLLTLPEVMHPMKRPFRISLLVTALVFFIFTLIPLDLNNIYYFLGVLIVLVSEIFYLNSVFYGLNIPEDERLKLPDHA